MVKIAVASRVIEAGMASLIQSSLVMFPWEGEQLSWHNQQAASTSWWRSVGWLLSVKVSEVVGLGDEVVMLTDELIKVGST